MFGRGSIAPERYLPYLNLLESLRGEDVGTDQLKAEGYDNRVVTTPLPGVIARRRFAPTRQSLRI